MTKSNEVIRIGVIGCGKRIFDLINRVRQLDNGIVIDAIVEPDAANRTKAQAVFNPGMEVYDDHNALAHKSGVSWVIIGSLNAQHADHAVACLEAGKDVICEKPLATTIEDCLAIRKAVERTGKRFALNLTMRYSPMDRKIKQCLDGGMIGRPISVEFNEILGMNHGGMIHGNWRRYHHLAGSHLLEKCCHDIDCMQWFLGSRASRVASFGGCNFFVPGNQGQIARIGPGPDGAQPFMADPRCETNPFTAGKDIIDNQVIIIEYENQVRATFHLNCCAAITERRVYICGTEGTLRGDRVTGRLEIQKVGWDQPRSVWPSLLTEGGHGGADEVLCREWIDMLRNGTRPTAGVSEGLDSALTCFGIDKSMREGEMIDLRSEWSKIDSASEAIAT